MGSEIVLVISYDKYIKISEGWRYDFVILFNTIKWNIVLF